MTPACPKYAAVPVEVDLGKRRRIAPFAIIPLAVGCGLLVWALATQGGGETPSPVSPGGADTLRAGADAGLTGGPPGEMAPGLSHERVTPRFSLVEVTERTGIELETVCGSPEKRYIVEANGAGVGLLDFDGDGALDIYVVNGSTLKDLLGGTGSARNALYRNEGDWRFTDVTDRAGVGDTGWGFACAVGDIDNDGDPDLYVSNLGPNVLYRNQGDGTFEEVAAEAGVADEAWGESAAFADFDRDGLLDLYLCNKLRFDPANPPVGPLQCRKRGIPIFCGPLGLDPVEDRLFRNEGDGRFSDASESSGIHEPEPAFGLGVVTFDFDDDGWTDIYVANDSVPNYLFRNEGGGRFEELGDASGVARSGKGQNQAGMGIACGDLDGDQRPDLFVTNFSDDYNTLYWNAGDGSFWDVTARDGLSKVSFAQLGWGTAFVDLDNDADLDLYVANGHVYPDVEKQGLGMTYPQGDQVFLNDGAGRLTEVHDRLQLSSSPRSSRGLAIGDLDSDGDLDAVVTEIDDVPTVLENRGGNEGSWLLVRLVGTKSNREGVGARVSVTAAGRTQRKEVRRSGSYASSSDVRLHFGLGEATQVERLEVLWPAGGRQTFRSVPARRIVVIHEVGGLLEGAPGRADPVGGGE